MLDDKQFMDIKLNFNPSTEIVEIKFKLYIQKIMKI